MSRGASTIALETPCVGTLPLAPPRLVRRVARTAAVAVLWVVLGCSTTLAVLTAGSALLGGKPTFNVLSGSMAPALEVGSVVIDERIPPLDARPGDMVTFPHPDNRRRLVTHRVKSVTVSGKTVSFVTKGDANPTAEHWNVGIRDEIGRVAYHAPKLGYLRAWAAAREGRLAAVGLVLAWGLAALFGIWRPRAR